jgi:hypothetical protein
MKYLDRRRLTILTLLCLGAMAASSTVIKAHANNLQVTNYGLPPGNAPNGSTVQAFVVVKNLDVARTITVYITEHDSVCVVGCAQSATMEQNAVINFTFSFIVVVRPPECWGYKTSPVDPSFSTCGLVGGAFIPVDRFGVLAPFIGLAFLIGSAISLTAFHVKRFKRKEAKQ